MSFSRRADHLLFLFLVQEKLIAMVFLVHVHLRLSKHGQSMNGLVCLLAVDDKSDIVGSNQKEDVHFGGPFCRPSPERRYHHRFASILPVVEGTSSLAKDSLGDVENIRQSFQQLILEHTCHHHVVLSIDQPRCGIKMSRIQELAESTLWKNFRGKPQSCGRFFKVTYGKREIPLIVRFA